MATRKPKSGVSGATYEPGKGTRVTPGPRPAPFRTPKRKPLPKGTLYSDELESSQSVGDPSDAIRAGKRKLRGNRNPSGIKRQLPHNRRRRGANRPGGMVTPQMLDAIDSEYKNELGPPDPVPADLDGPSPGRMAYDRFVQLHGGKSTANLAGKFRARFGGRITDEMGQAMNAAAMRRSAARRKRGLPEDGPGLVFK